MHAKLGNKAEALKQLELALTLDVEDINAWLQKEDVYPILKNLKRRRWGMPAPASAPADESSSSGAGGAEASGFFQSSEQGSWQPLPRHAQGFPSMCEHANPYHRCMRDRDQYALSHGLQSEVPGWLQHGREVLGGWRDWGASLQPKLHHSQEMNERAAADNADSHEP